MLENRLVIREQRGILFSEYVWCLLVKTVIERFDRKIRMGEILCSIIKPKEVLAVKA